MKNTRFSWLAGAFAALSLAACDEGVRSPDYLPVLDTIEVCAAPGNDLEQCPSSGCSTANAVVPAGRSQQFCAVGFYAGLNTEDAQLPRTARNITGEVLWESSLVNFASIDPETGLAQTQTEGTTLITASTNGVTGAAQLRVTDPDLESLSISPGLVAQTVVGAVTPFTCTAQYSNDACVGSSSVLCDVTDTTDWSSLRPSVAVVGNNPEPGLQASKGVMTAVTPGTTAISCTGQNLAGDDVVAIAQPVNVCEATLLAQPNGLRFTRAGVPIDSADPLLILPGQSIPLGLLGTYINNDPNCGTVGAQFTVDLTESANWVADQDGTIVAVGNRFRNNKGQVTYVSPGLAEVSATFQGATVSIPFIAVDASVRALTISGPQYLFAPGNYPYQAQALYRLAEGSSTASLPEDCEADAADSQNQFLCDVTTSRNIVWSTVLADGTSGAGIAEIFNNDGQLIVAADAPPQVVTIAANYLGQSGAVSALIVPAKLTDIQIKPGLSCLSSGTLGLLDISPRSRQLDLDLIYDVTLPTQDEPVSCRVSQDEVTRNSELAFWLAQASEPLAETTVNSGGDLLDLLPNLIDTITTTLGAGPVAEDFRQGCLPLLPVGAIADDEDPTLLLTGAPATVSNQAGQRGVVEANQDALLTLLPNVTVGTACVSAHVTNSDGEELVASSTVLVATDVVPEVCSLLEGLTDNLLTDGLAPDLITLLTDTLGGLLGEESTDPEPQCVDVIGAAMDPEAADAGTQETESAGALQALLQGLLGLLGGGTR